VRSVNQNMQDYRAASLFQPSNLAKAIEQTMDPSSGAAPYLFGSIISIPHTIVARTVAVLGQDFIMVDAQHTYVHLHRPPGICPKDIDQLTELTDPLMPRISFASSKPSIYPARGRQSQLSECPPLIQIFSPTRLMQVSQKHRPGLPLR
jgi:hypothetical protein